MNAKLKSYGTLSSPAEVGKDGEVVYGILYRCGVRHIASYVPYKRPPTTTLCGQPAGVGTRSIENLCPACLAEAERILGSVEFK